MVRGPSGRRTAESSAHECAPGAHTQGATLGELQGNLQEVIEMLLEDGEPLVKVPPRLRVSSHLRVIPAAVRPAKSRFDRHHPRCYSKRADGGTSHKYWAFISYSHRDKAWGDWLHRSLEIYRIPPAFVGCASAEDEIPARLYPVFRDRDALPTASDLGASIRERRRGRGTLLRSFREFLSRSICGINGATSLLPSSHATETKSQNAPHLGPDGPTTVVASSTPRRPSSSL